MHKILKQHQLINRKTFDDRLARGRAGEALSSADDWYNDFTKQRILENQPVKQDDLILLTPHLDQSLAEVVCFFENRADIQDEKVDPQHVEAFYQEVYLNTMCLIEGRKVLSKQIYKQMVKSTQKLNVYQEDYIDNQIAIIKDIARLDALLFIRTEFMENGVTEIPLIPLLNYNRYKAGIQDLSQPE